MTIKEKVAYLQGLAEGLDIEASNEGRLLAAIIDTLEDVAEEIAGLSENALDIGDELDALSDDLADVEDILEELDLDDLYDEDFDYDDFDDDDDDDDEYCCDICGGEMGDGFSIDVNCPECGTEIEIGEEDIAAEEVTCPACGKVVELEIDEIDVDDDDNVVGEDTLRTGEK